MEPQRFYECDNNKLFNVHFANWQGLSIDQITEIFSKFGQVVAVREAGDAFGYRFVRYRQEDEVVRCVEGLRNHPTIRLKVKNPNYKKPDQEKQSSDQYSQKNIERNGHRLDNNNHQSVENLDDKSTKNHENTQHLKNNISPVAMKNRLSEQKNNVQGVKTEVQLIQAAKTEPPNVVKAPETLNATRTPQFPKIAMRLRKPEVPAESFMPVYNKTQNDEKSSTKPTVTSPIIAVPLMMKPEEIPQLVTKSPGRASVDVTGTSKSPQPLPLLETRTVTAEEVVVANIHSDFGTHYILHLIQKHDPLSVSAMKMIPSLGLRYCIVYLQSLQQAYAVEKEFDKFLLSGKNLIVMRSNRLAEMVGSA